MGYKEGVTAISASTTAATLGGVSFGTSPTVTFGIATAAGGSATITASAVGGGGAGDGYNILAAGTETAALSTTVLFSNSNAIYFGMSGSSRITASLSFSNANGISFGTSAGPVITASHNAITSQSNQVLTMYATSNTVSSSSGTTNASSLVFRGLGGASVGISGGSVLVSAGAAGGGGVQALGVSTDAGGPDTGSYTGSFWLFGNSAGGGIVLAQDTNAAGHSISIAGPLAATTVSRVESVNVVGTNTDYYARLDHQHAGLWQISVGGNTAGNTTAGAGSLMLAGGPNITLSGGTAAGGMTLSVSAGAGGGGGAAPQISKWPVYDFGMAYSTVNSGTSGTAVGSTLHSISGFIASVPLPYDLHFQTVMMMLSGAATVSGSGTITLGHCFGIYTLNGNSALSLSTSFMAAMHMTQSSITSRAHHMWWGTNSTSNSTSIGGNVSASFTGARAVLMNTAAHTLTAGNYFFVYVHTARTLNSTIYNQSSVAFRSGSQTTGAPLLGTSVTSHPYLWGGVFSTVISNTSMALPVLPLSIHTSRVTHTGGSSQWRIPYLLLYRSVT